MKKIILLFVLSSIFIESTSAQNIKAPLLKEEGISKEVNLSQAFKNIGPRLGGINQHHSGWVKVRAKMELGDNLLLALMSDYEEKGPNDGVIIAQLSSLSKDQKRQINQCAYICGCSCFAERCANHYIDSVCKKAQS